MHLRKVLPLGALLAGLLALGAGPADAASYVHAGTATGNVLAAGTAFQPTSGSMTFSQSSFGTISCSSTGGLTAGVSGGSSIAVTVDSLEWPSCTDTIPSLTFTSCSGASSLPTASLTAAGGAGGTLLLSNVYLRCALSGTTRACYYHATVANGTYTNATGGVSWTGVSLAHGAPAGTTDDLGSLCGAAGSMNQSWSGVTVGTTGATLVLNDTP
jgi:hypothetical protein